MQYATLIANIKARHFFGIALVLSGICAFCRLLPTDDVFMRYAPAAEAFAGGDWKYAFHPRFGVYFTAFAGIFVSLFHCSGIAACQFVSVIFFSLAVFPLHALFEKVWGQATAFWGTLAYIFTSHLLRYAGEGLRDNGKTLALALIALSLVSLTEKKSWKNVQILAAGGALLTVIRGEGFLIAFLCGIVALYILKDWKKSVAGIFLFLILISPQCFYNYRVIGYFVPELRHGVILYRLGIPPARCATVKIPETAR